ncbi:MAG: hypothetical protein J6K94_08055 [Ruminiclostridium sp.]|nr:hypothetical protein [Ruminiclostridium sp.]
MEDTGIYQKNTRKGLPILQKTGILLYTVAIIHFLDKMIESFYRAMTMARRPWRQEMYCTSFFAAKAASRMGCGSIKCYGSILLKTSIRKGECHG